MKQTFEEQFSRILNLYQVLPKAPHNYISINDLEPKIKNFYLHHEVPRKTIQRDLVTLGNILHKGKVEKISALGRSSASFRLSADAKLNTTKKNIIQDEFQALATIHSYRFLQNYFPKSWQASLQEHFDQAIKALELKHKKAWMAKLGIAFDGAFQNYLNPIDEVKELIFESIHEDHIWLEITYHPEDFRKQANVYLIKPHGIIVRGRKQYLIATKIDNKQRTSIRTFTLHRILVAKSVSESISIDIQNLEMQKAIDGYEYEGFFNRNDQAIEIELYCHAEILSEIQFSPIHSSQRIFHEDGCHFSLSATLPLSYSLVDWLVQKSTCIEVIEPQYLRTEIKDKIQNQAFNYNLDVTDPDDELFEEWDENPVDENHDIHGKAIQNLERLIADTEPFYEAPVIDEFKTIYEKAINFILNKKEISTKDLQNNFKIGYNFSVKIIDQMEQDRVIAPIDENGIRKVLISGK